MNIAVMADIHSNHIALEACIAEARKRRAEEFLFLFRKLLSTSAFRQSVLLLVDLLMFLLTLLFSYAILRA